MSYRTFNMIMEDEKIVDRTDAYIVVKNLKTGATRTLLLVDLDKSDVRSKKQIKAFIKMKKKDETGFVQVKRIIEEILLKLSQVHSSCLAKLLTIIEFNDNIIKINGKEAKMKDYQEFFGVSKMIVTSFFKEMTNETNPILEEVKKGTSIYYKMTDNYIYRGEFSDPEYHCVKIFQQELAKRIEKVEELLKEKGKKKAFPLSMFMALIPYVDPQTFIICQNYESKFEESFIGNTEKELKKSIRDHMKLIKPLKQTQLWRIVTGNKDLKRIYKAEKERMAEYMDILMEANIIQQFGPKTKKIHFFNPNLLFVTQTYSNPLLYDFINGLFETIDIMNGDEEEN